MAQGPIEFRYFHRKFSMPDAELGIMPVRIPPDVSKLFCPTVLQYRYKFKTSVGGAIEMVWSEWQNIGVVIEGRESPPDESKLD